MKFLGVRDKFTLDCELPYLQAIRHINRIEQCETPHEMVCQLSLTYASLKSEVVDFHRGRVELEAMDDVLPLSIYCVAMSSLQHAATLQSLMEDYLRTQSGYDLERKLLCNFDCAVRYVTHDYLSEKQT